MMQRFLLVLSVFFGAMTMNLPAQSRPLPVSASGPAVHAKPAVTLPAQASVLYNFGASATDGSTPQASLIQASDGNFYGVTQGGGVPFEGYSNGAIFQLTPSGQETLVYSFMGTTDGYSPTTTPVEASDGNLYGTTQGGGNSDSSGDGTIWQYNLKTGVLTTLYVFESGGDLLGGLIDDGNGTLYGTTAYGPNNNGTIFSFNYKTNTFTNLYDFTNGSDGSASIQKLVLGADGNLYGTALGGADSAGVAFMLGTDGSNFQVIHTFTGGSDGSFPVSLVQYSDGNFYGATSAGGAGSGGTFFQIVPNGANSTFNTLYSFMPASDGYDFTSYGSNSGALSIGGDGKFYATTFQGGANSLGQIVQLDSLGHKTDVFDFTATLNSPSGVSLLESTDGNLYGTTQYTGTYGEGGGSIYKLTIGLPPVIQLSPSVNAVEPGSSFTLTWAVTNAFSKDAQICLANSSDGSWTGVVPPSGNATITPTAASGIVTYAFTCGGVETATAAVSVGNGLTVTTTALPNGAVGASYSQALGASGGTSPYTWSISSGSLPQGLSLAAGSNLISGTPTQNGTENFAVEVKDSTGATASASFAITITSTPLTIATSTLPAGVLNAYYSQTLTAAGGTAPYLWSVATGSLPAGLSLNPSTGVLSGTLTTAGSSSFAIKVTDSESPQADATANFIVTVTASTLSLPAQDSIFYSFGATTNDAQYPKGALMRASDGNFYGVSASGGTPVNGNFQGAIYQITPSGQESVVYSFTGGNDGCVASVYFPGNTPVEATDGNLYGTTTGCGTEGGGTIWQYNLKTGTFTTVYEQPYMTVGGRAIASLIDGGNGNLYGVTADGDATATNYDGTVFSFNYTTDALTTLHSFVGTDGTGPEAVLVLGSDGNLYGTTTVGGNSLGNGVVFSVGTDGSNFQVIHTFDQAVDGSEPTDLVLYADGNLYGSTALNGTGGNGNFFRITPNGANSTFTIVYNFAPTDGHETGDSFIGGDGKFYLASLVGGANSLGQIMQLDSQGNKADVFDYSTSTNHSAAPLFESVDGNLYDPVGLGAGTYSDGAIYKLTVGLPPAITLTPSASAVDPGSPVTLTWAVTNAFSKNAQICLATSSDNSWTGVVAPNGTASVTPTVSSGVVTYGITCGGTETALAAVNVGSTAFMVTTTALPNGSIGATYSATLAATNGKTPYTWSIQSGALPQGLSLSGAGVVSGTPTENGTSNFVVQVTDSAGATATASLAITITTTPLTIAQANLLNGTVGTAYSQAFAATGGQAPYSWAIASGSLPPGLSLAPATGVVSGTPTRTGTFNFSIQVTDSETTPAIQTAKGNLAIQPAESTFPASGASLWTFPGYATDGVQPAAGLMEASDGNFYGTTCCAGGSDAGTLYKMPATGVANKETTAAYFSLSTTGYGSSSTPIEAADGNLYGTTPNGGPNKGGALYQYNLQTGALTLAYGFPQTTYGSVSDLIDDGNGTLYGTIPSGGANSMGSVWSWNYNTQTFTTLYSFTGGNDGKSPNGGVLLGSDGNLYGLTSSGGAAGFGVAYSLGTDGSNFQVLHSFTNGADGGSPYGELTEYSDGNFYGVTNTGGANGFGSFFQFVPKGASSVVNPIYQFQSGDGLSYPDYWRPFIGGDGKFYIATRQGGASDIGEVMQLDTLGNKADVFDFSSYFAGGNGYPESSPTEGMDGNLYGTDYIDGVYQIQTYLPPAISLHAGVTDVTPGDSFQLTWAVNNAFSKNAQVCIGRSTDNSWAGAVPTSGTATVTPTAAGAVTYAVTCGGSETAFVTINGDTPLVVKTSSLANGTVDTAYSAALTASGGTPPYIWVLTTGSLLPQGISLSSTGQITGTPLDAGTTVFQVQVTDSEPTAQTVTTNFSITVNPRPLVITTASLSNGAVGLAYSQSLGATGGTVPYTWSIVSGSLPSGLTITPASGLISGTPTATGTRTFTVQLADAASTPATVTQSYTITVQPQPPSITTTSLPSGTVGTAYSQALTVTGGTAPYTWSIKNGSLPTGLMLAAGTGVISGTPTASVVSNFTVQATDSESTPVSAAATLSIMVNPASGPTLLTPTVTANVNPAFVSVGQSTTLSATVAGATGSSAPMGTVQFQVNGVNLGAPVALSGGTATLANQSFTATGSYAITADYSGDASYTAVNSAAVTLTVTTATPTVTANPTTVTVSAPGATGTTTLTVANFTSTSVAFTCAGLPTGAACTAGTVSSSNTATLQITTTGSSTAQLTSPKTGNGSPRLLYASVLPGLFAIAGLFTFGLRNRQWRRMLMVLLLLSAGMAMTACGSANKGSGGGNPNQTPAGTSSVTVTATAGSQSASTTITLTVQ